MAISGSLEDVSVADVMQFIHLGRRTGTLALSRDGDVARIGFHNGKLVSAKGPGTPMLGDLLITGGHVDPQLLREAVSLQASEAERRSLGQILLTAEAVTPELLRQVIGDQIERTVSDLVQWDRGTFEFIVDDQRPVDDIAVYHGDLLPDSDINTQMVLLEAARIFDEKNRDLDRRTDVGDQTNPTLVLSSSAALALASHPVEAPPAPAPVEMPTLELGAHRLQIVSSDEELASRLSRALPPGFAPVERVGLVTAGKPIPGHETPLLVLDLRDGVVTLDDVSRLRRTRLGTPLIALLPPHLPSGPVYEAGALAALPPELDAITACVANLARNRRRSAPASTGLLVPSAPRESVARLRRVYGDLRSGLITATVALNLMHIVSESVERAVLFLVRRDRLTALGAFGVGASGRPLAELTRGIQLDLAEPNALTETVHTGEVYAVPFAEANLPPALRAMVGEPASGQAVIFPVMGTQRVIAVIYADNGEDESPIEDIDILELATAQVGMAFENELLRRQISQQG